MKTIASAAGLIALTTWVIGTGFQEKPKRAPAHINVSAADVNKALSAQARIPLTSIWKLSSTLSPALMRQGPYSLSFLTPNSIWAGEIAIMEGVHPNSPDRPQSTVIVEMDGLQIGRKYGVVFDLGTYTPKDPVEWDVAFDDVWSKQSGKVPGVVMVTFTPTNARSHTVKLKMASDGWYNLRTAKIYRT